MEKWEYLVGYTNIPEVQRGWVVIYVPKKSLKDKPESRQVSLNELGEQGWEMVGMTGTSGSLPQYAFKRRLP